MIRELIREVILEYWSQHLDKVLDPGDPLPFANDPEEETMEDNPMNPYDANDDLRKVKANAHLKTQKAGVARGSGPAGGSASRFPGGTRQGTSGVY